MKRSRLATLGRTCLTHSLAELYIYECSSDRRSSLTSASFLWLQTLLQTAAGYLITPWHTRLFTVGRPHAVDSARSPMEPVRHAPLPKQCSRGSKDARAVPAMPASRSKFSTTRFSPKGRQARWEQLLVHVMLKI